MTPLLRSLVVRRKDVIVALISYREAQEREQRLTAVAIGFEGNWAAIPCADELVSLCLDASGAVLALGRDGGVHVFRPGAGQPAFERARAPDASTGYLWRIARLGDDTIVSAGTFGEVYWRAPTGWAPLGSIRDDCQLEKPPTIWALAGRSRAELYAAGQRGALFAFDGRAWRALPSPTRRTLHDLACMADGTLAACGESMTLIRGAADSWEVLSSNSSDEDGEDLWSVVTFEGRLHAAGRSHIYREDAGRLLPLEIPLEGFQTWQLAATETQLWSAGERFLARYEAGTWTPIPLP